MEILRDPLWQFLGFFVAFLALAIALLQRPRKSLWWENYHFAPLFIEKGLAPEASVEIAGRTFIVLDLQEIVVEVFNRGNIAIEATHYERPLMFEFGEKAKIVAAEMLYEEPPGIGTRWCWGYNWISLVPAALNAGDLLEIRFLVFRARYVRMDGRIVGVKQIRQGSVELRTAALLVLGLVESLLLVPSVYLPLFVPEGLFGWLEPWQRQPQCSQALACGSRLESYVEQNGGCATFERPKTKVSTK